MDHCHAAELMCDDNWFKTVVLCGGTAYLPGLAERLEKELHELLPPSVPSGTTVIPPLYGMDSAWFGAKVISNLSTFPGAWCVTNKQFRQKFKRNLMGSWLIVLGSFWAGRNYEVPMTMADCVREAAGCYRTSLHSSHSLVKWPE
ncbi:Actin-like protein arp8 [Ancistrocladus abbreviatus]